MFFLYVTIFKKNTKEKITINAIHLALHVRIIVFYEIYPVNPVLESRRVVLSVTNKRQTDMEFVKKFTQARFLNTKLYPKGRKSQ